MARTSDLNELGIKLTTGLRRFAHAFRHAQTTFLLSAQTPDGGFAGRQGPPDVYYTAFGLRAMRLLEVFDPTPWQRAAGFIRAQPLRLTSVVDALSLVEAARLVGHVLGDEALDRSRIDQAASHTLAACRGPSGGFGAEPGMDESVYHTFLAGRCLSLMAQPAASTPSWFEAIVARQRDDGGFADQTGPVRGGTNPTAAAVMLLAHAGAAALPVIACAVEFLVSCQRPDGGFAAHADAPRPDLLSTFTALVALDEVDRLDRVRMADVARFVRSLAHAGGGFRAACCDDAVDVEYTYYGLGTLGLLGSRAPSRPHACPRCRAEGGAR